MNLRPHILLHEYHQNDSRLENYICYSIAIWFIMALVAAAILAAIVESR